MRCYNNSDVASPQEMLKFWWGNLRKMEEQSYLDKFITEDEIVDILLQKCVAKLRLKENLEELHKLFQNFWMNSPAYDDVKEFFQKSSLPIYVVTNNGVEYVRVAMETNDLHPVGIVCGDMARAYKPHRELFEKALEISGYKAGEVLHIGDSMFSDVNGAKAAGILPVLLDREGKNRENGVKSIRSLLDVFDLFSL